MVLTILRNAMILWVFLAGSVAAQVTPERMLQSLIAANEQDWDTATRLAPDVLTLDLVTWMRLRSGADSFEDYQAFTTTRFDWPGMDRVFARGEESIPEGYSAGQVIGWLGDRLPQTGVGAVRLAQAYGPGLKALDVLEKTWVHQRLDKDGHDVMVAEFGDLIAPFHMRRVEELLWRSRRTEADWMLPLLTDDQRALVEARLAYGRNSGDLVEKLEAVPDPLKDDAGLAYDRYNWLSDRGSKAQAVDLLLERSTSVAALGEPFRWSGWRRSLARSEMRAGRSDRAYQVASKHFLTEGSSFADLEWVAGYVSLQYLDKPEQALAHFQTALAAVDTPISIGRMAYWSARALEVLGNADAAQAAYAQAAEHMTGFYGLLAAEKLGMSLDPTLTGRADPTEWRGAPVMGTELVRAAFGLLEAGARSSAVSFFRELGLTLDADGVARVGTLLVEMDEAWYAILLSKSALTQGVLVPSIYYPRHGLADLRLPVSNALALSIARRESEFNIGIGSSVGALGLMQLMPATAEEVAGMLGEPYSRARLTSDWEYNARLGARYLRELQDEFGPSPVQIAAGYNAGPSRPKAWMDERGDPRLGEVDVIDWIEHIPFRETRNYVMHVAESLPIYEARLSGVAPKVELTRILLGEKPLIRPILRPTGLGPVIVEEAEAPVVTAPETAPRPNARPAE